MAPKKEPYLAFAAQRLTDTRKRLACYERPVFVREHNTTQTGEKKKPQNIEALTKNIRQHGLTDETRKQLRQVHAEITGKKHHYDTCLPKGDYRRT